MSECKNTDNTIKKQSYSNMIHDFIRVLFRIIYQLLVDMVANFVSDILDHPRVQKAAAETLVRGMKLTMEQPDLPHRAAKIYIQIQEDTDVSRQLGEQFPKVAANFIAGAATSLKRSASFSNLMQRQQQHPQQQQTTRRSSLHSTNSFDNHYQKRNKQQQGSIQKPQEQHVYPMSSPITSGYKSIFKSTTDGQHPVDGISAATREEVVIQQLSSLSWRNNKAFNRVESLTSIASIDSLN